MKIGRFLRCAIVVCLVVAVLSGTAGAWTLKTTNEVKWIDRIADLPEFAKTFYSWLETQGKAGKDGALADPTKAENVNGMYVYQVPYTDSVTLDLSSYGTAEEREAAKSDAMSQLKAPAGEHLNLLSNVFMCFTRDHPEVFWLNGTVSTSMTRSFTTSTMGSTCTIKFNAKLMVILKNEEFDIRAPKYLDSSVLTNAIQARDSAVTAITAGATGSRYDKIVYLNDWLTKNNAYNSSNNLSAIDVDCRTCISALRGSAGVNGPVCEGYAEAFKVLCDKLEIPCVVVSGIAYTGSGPGEAHMWNKVQMEDGKWYGVDATWNDPVIFGKQEQKVSGGERTLYLLVGTETVCGPLKFGVSHAQNNQISVGGILYMNDPVLSDQAYTPPSCAHNYTHTVTAATCTTDGYTTHTCTLCGNSYVDSPVSAPGHHYNSVVTAATCTTDGYTTHTCTACSHSYKDQEVTATGHNYNKVVTAPTCTKDGYTTYTCSNCGDNYKGDETPAAHDYEVTVYPPTCLMNGYTDHVCKQCGDKYYDNVVDTLSHDYQETVVPPTCTEDGYTMHKCSGCSHVYYTDYVGAAHSYKSVVTNPTCNAVGYTTHTCTLCGDQKTDSYVPNLEHEMVIDSAKDATCTEPGLTMGMHCNLCGEVLTAQIELPVLGHEFGGWGKHDLDHHARSCQRAGCSEIEKAAHNWTYHITGSYSCDICGETCQDVKVKRDSGTVMISFVKRPEQMKYIMVTVYDNRDCLVDIVIPDISDDEVSVKLEKWSAEKTVKIFYLNDKHAPMRMYQEV